MDEMQCRPTPNDTRAEKGASILDQLAAARMDEILTERPKETDAEAVARLSAMTALEYDRCRVAEAKAIGVRPATLDAMIKGERATEEAPQTPFAEVEPWPEPVDPAVMLSEVSDLILRFIVLDREQADAAALWAAFTHLIDAVEVAPLLLANAPEKACGKSQLLTLIGWLVKRPLPAANSSSAFLFRAVGKWTPTVLIDEADTFIRDNEELKGLINAGHTRQNAYVGRVVGDNHEPTLFPVWSAKAMAGIALEKHLPDATMSRAIVINMRRKLPGEKVERLRYAEHDLFEKYASMLARFGVDYHDEVRRSRPTLPDALSDRAQDNWEPLLSIAGCAGPTWLDRATRAALKLSGKSETAQSASNELLGDILHVFESKQVARIGTADLIAALIEDDEAAWATYNRGRPLSPRQLANMLKGYGIASKNVRIGYEQAKGYERQQFDDVFARYLAATPENARPGVPMAANPITTGLYAGRDAKPGTHAESAPVPLKPAWNKAGDVGTHKTPVLRGGSAEVEV